jgi:endonuclease/exonuclease/phosphatase family metal-dependent hydrolase
MLLFQLACAGSPSDADPGFDYGSHELVPFESVLVDGFLCPDAEDPEGAEDVQFIECVIEGDNELSPEPVDQLLVMTYNAERGEELEAQLAAFGETVPMPDVLLLAESDRFCPRSGDRNVTREMAQALGMNWAYAVEFVELPRGSQTEPCEHGNAVLSRFPLANVQQIRHAENLSWYDSAGQPRLGGRIAVAADVVVGERVLHVVTVHFESEVGAFDIQAAQGLETAVHAAAQPFGVLVGGDTNAPFYTFDLLNGGDSDQTVGPFLDRGFEDTHMEIDPAERGTHDLLVLDLLLVRDADHRDPAICAPEDCGALSDHLPVWATLELHE